VTAINGDEFFDTVKGKSQMLLSLFLIGCQASGDYEIIAYDAKFVVHGAKRYTASEWITVDFPSRRHGLIRTLPKDTESFHTEYSDISVPGYKFSLDKGRDNVVIKIGDQYKWINGVNVFPISYVMSTTTAQHRHHTFSLNVIGCEWDVKIRDVTFSVTFPEGTDFSHLKIHSGRKGSTSNYAGCEYDVKGTILRGQCAKLGPGEGVTVSLGVTVHGEL
jgi:hypothetical protein